MKVFFTGCTHYFHKNICRGVSHWEAGWRNFDTLQQMNDTIVNNINSVVGENDLLYHLGDWSFGGYDKIKEFRYRIKCNKIALCGGNHDDHIRKDDKKELQQLFNQYYELTETTVHNQRFVLCHYPLEVWNGSHRDVWTCHSHCHGSLKDNLFKKRIDIGFDTEYLVCKSTNRLIMTTNYDKEPIGEGKYRQIDRNNCRVIHPRFHPFTFNEIQEIMSYKNSKPVDHHNRSNQQ